LNAKNAGRILVVDDNEVALDALAELLRREGFSVLTTRGGMDALHQAKTDERVSLMLLDLWMPLMDGWEVLRQKSQDSRIADIPVM
jgi:CheY-like chemotaxis protein